jgi:hypothetical protein
MSPKAERGGRDFDLPEVESTNCVIPIRIHSKLNRNQFKKYVAELIRVAEKIRQLYYFERCFSGRPDQRLGCLYWWFDNAWKVVLFPDVLSTRPIATIAKVITTENLSLLAQMWATIPTRIVVQPFSAQLQFEPNVTPQFCFPPRPR